ncbi:MAG: peptidoglycan-associated lipoprotein Pal [Burkholderiales bacterium]|nr:peptidoglycan-associated lipoprotein Pal [Burkholderiales bacterium]
MLRYLLLAGLASGLLSACSSTPVARPAESAPASTVVQAPPARTGPSTASTGQVASASANVPSHLDPNSLLSREHSVYFEFDDAVVAQEFRPLVERQAQYLVRNPSLAVAVQGNADERGSSEYNLALGQRRAQAVKSAMQLLGVKDAQVEAVSLGEEKPMATGHDDASWRQNRRADIVYRR